MKIAPDMRLDDLADLMGIGGETTYTPEQAQRMRALLVERSTDYGWKNTSDVEDTEWNVMLSESRSDG